MHQKSLHISNRSKLQGILMMAINDIVNILYVYLHFFPEGDKRGIVKPKDFIFIVYQQNKSRRWGKKQKGDIEFPPPPTIQVVKGSYLNQKRIFWF